MKVLVLGGDGMLGHRLAERLRASHETAITLRRERADYAQFPILTGHAVYDRVAVPGDAVRRAIESFRPAAVVNCIGIVKQTAAAHDAVPSIEVNALFPHQAAAWAADAGARFMHVSTDCVFSGLRGTYTEGDIPDPVDLYGRSKLLGEPSGGNCLTIRTSIVGPELSRKTGLLEWFLAQRGRRIRGFRRAIFSGLSTLELSRVIERLLVSFPEATGLYHVSTSPLNKYDLLMLFKETMRVPVEIEPDDTLVCDRSLDSSAFRSAFAYDPPDWPKMALELAHTMRLDR